MFYEDTAARRRRRARRAVTAQGAAGAEDGSQQIKRAEAKGDVL